MQEESTPSMSTRRWTAIAVTVAASVLLLANTPPASAAGATSVQAQAADPPQAPTTVVLDAKNSKNITDTPTGSRLLGEFAQRIQAKGISAARSAQAVASEYNVISVDVAKILPDSRCERGPETLILPRSTTQVRYIGGPRNDQDGNNPCLVTVEWDDRDPDPHAQDDPQSGSRQALAAAEAPYVEQYHEYCAARKTYTDFWEEPCYKRFVLKYDGNSSWNYYSFEAWNTCRNTIAAGALISCGRGQEAAADSPTLYSVDYSPQNPSTGTCRSISYEVQLYSVFTVGGSYNHCEEQLVYDYPEPGKMSTYWKGETTSQRTTRHQVSVKVAQNDGRPQWTNWFNGETCNYIDGGFCI